MYPGIVGAIVEAFAGSTEAAPEPIALQFLVGSGSAMGRGPALEIGATRHGVNENLIVAGKTSKARKGDSKGVALRPLELADPDWAMRCVASGLSSGEGLVHRVRDAIEKRNKKGEIDVVDDGVTDKRLLVVETEFSNVLKVMTREGNTLSPVLRDSWDGRAVLGTLTKQSPTRASGAHISIIGHTTPEDLHAHLADVDAANGLMNRFLFVLTTRERLLAVPERVSAPVLDALAARVRRALEAAHHVTDLRLTYGAEALWRGIYPALSGDVPGLVGAVLGRAEPHVLRLAAIYALLREAQEIHETDLVAALAAWDICDSSARVIFAGRTGDALADRVREALLPGESVDLTELHERLGKHTPASRLRDALALLAGLGDLHVGQEATAGRPRAVLTRRPEAGWPAEAEGQEPREAAHA
jgi:hypothetical protein